MAGECSSSVCEHPDRRRAFSNCFVAVGVNRRVGRRIAVLAAEGFEKVELTIPMRALQLAGAKVDVISLRHERIRGVNLPSSVERPTGRHSRPAPTPPTLPTWPPTQPGWHHRLGCQSHGRSASG
ncbi:MAG: protease [Mycobacterium sp.]|nr:protease [Mycobacterium sp.]